MQDIEVHSCDIISWQASFPVVRSGVFLTFRLAAVKLWNKERQKKKEGKPIIILFERVVFSTWMKIVSRLLPVVTDCKLNILSFTVFLPLRCSAGLHCDCLQLGLSAFSLVFSN